MSFLLTVGFLKVVNQPTTTTTGNANARCGKCKPCTSFKLCSTSVHPRVTCLTFINVTGMYQDGHWLGFFFPTVAKAIINTTVGRSSSNVGKEKPKVNACCLGSSGLFLHLSVHLRLTPVECQGETEGAEGMLPKETQGRTISGNASRNGKTGHFLHLWCGFPFLLTSAWH